MNNSNWRMGLVSVSGDIKIPTAPMRSPFFMTWATFNVVVGSTGNKTIDLKVLGQTCTFTVNFATTGSYTLAVGIVIRNIGNTRSVIIFPPTYVTKSAGTTPTNGILPSTQSISIIVDIGGNISIYVLPSPGVHTSPTPGCINWLTNSARDPNLFSSYNVADPLTNPSATVAGKSLWDADENLTTSPTMIISWTGPRIGTPVIESTFFNPSGSIVVESTLGVVTYGSGSILRIIRTAPEPDIIRLHFPEVHLPDRPTLPNPGYETVRPALPDGPPSHGNPNLTDQLANAANNATMPVGNGIAGAPQNLDSNAIGD